MTAEEKKRITAARRCANKARNFPTNTCPASRHLHIMAEQLIRHGKYPMFEEEPIHCAETMLAVLASLWELRTKDDEATP